MTPRHRARTELRCARQYLGPLPPASPWEGRVQPTWRAAQNARPGGLEGRLAADALAGGPPGHASPQVSGRKRHRMNVQYIRFRPPRRAGRRAAALAAGAALSGGAPPLAAGPAPPPAPPPRPGLNPPPPPHSTTPPPGPDPAS